ncbi:PIH1 domain-containing protein 1 isoform X2 [Hyla sarda]|uniref:PIH1 domain-containing protein 1 isoform X2 n=1 Tax=Hyla sarda TaxID=327740 RepID=UPI0024C344F1|nr:PIH1 domain-containing protein 1 isoform X2 [Hyla sarda]
MAEKNTAGGEEMMESDKSLLSAEMNADMEEVLYEQMLMKAKQEIQSRLPDLQETKQIRPQPGFCIKTRTSKNAKIFINICKSNQIPAPPDLSEQELVSILESDDPSGYRVPMSLGEPHVEVDNSGGGCTAYDIVINSTFFEKIKNNELFMEFFITVAMEGLENKYEMELSREWRMLKNRKFMGSIFDQNIRTKSKPMIQEMDTKPSQVTPTKPLISEVESSPVKPEYTIVAEPPEGHPSFLVAEISLPKVSSARSLVLDLGEDRIVLVGRPDLYHLDIFIPYNIFQEQSGAQFNKDTKVLTITMPVQPA